ncbi:hypothetical protein [Bacillus amyloliquefaciens]|uniref:hypothetical protein n=1 Tax=Bacillus amyloliquefaciens TaxID=1390 RepID=UPI000E59C4BF|nr:hypothetical protein [Bacillus amyloliquefaciens]MCM3247817.1 hypothetical protein [Bacillus amyloliquefaciens]MCY7426152.1 hypothetical protein [Bacillus amyloliquefaciens]MEC0965142.1 hypothetical protein [Bacillus amyloliquefaciens]MEC1015856.1 hypothetical protein [Bacillus amyloliquefaciens]MEC2264513.1 hypothetical protein [Bacillus amyloliquefaciens]
MRNKAADRLVLTGVIVHIIQWFSVLWLFFMLLDQFGHFTIYNPNVVNGSMQSFSFFDMMRALLFSGMLRNTLLLFLFAALLIYLWVNALFILLEIVSYIMIRRNSRSLWAYFPAAMGIKLALLDIAAVPFFAAGLILLKQKTENGEQADKRKRRPRIRKQARYMKRRRRNPSV